MSDFTIRHDVYIHNDNDNKLDQILALLTRSAQMETQMALDLTALETEVAENTDAVASAATLLDTLAAELRAAASDPAAVQAIADALSQNSDNLAAAVVRNTPAA